MNIKLLTKFSEKFEYPSPIQAEVWKRFVTGENLSCIAPTGSGKTLAFLLPILSRILDNDDNQTNQKTEALILAPSQELAMQIVHVINAWGQEYGISSIGLIGGANGRRQSEKLKKGVNIVVGTIGRTLSMIEGKSFDCSSVKMLVIDEADEQLTNEKRADFIKLSQYLADDVQIALFSATKGHGQEMAEAIFSVKLSELVTEGLEEGNIRHEFQMVSENAKLALVKKIASKKQALVFFNTADNLQYAYARLKHDNFDVSVVGGYSNKNKMMRASSIQDFSKKKTRVLLATDVLARGVDIESLPYVINYDLPKTLKSYIHRAGRTGRAGKDGIILNLGNDHDYRNLKKMLADHYDLQKKKYDNKKANNKDNNKITSQVNETVKSTKLKKNKKKKNKDKGKPKWATK